MSEQNAEGSTYNLLFVCTGNTCRSPMAGALARDALRRRGWQHVEVATAGTSALAGATPSDHVPVVLAEQGIELGAHAAQELTPELVEWADMILVMSPSHLATARALGGEDKVALITDFLPRERAGRPVPDPIGADLETYRLTRDHLAEAIDAVLDRLEPIISP